MYSCDVYVEWCSKLIPFHLCLKMKNLPSYASTFCAFMSGTPITLTFVKLGDVHVFDFFLRSIAGQCAGSASLNDRR